MTEDDLIEKARSLEKLAAKGRTRRLAGGKIHKEAQRIYERAVFEEELAGKVINRFVRQVNGDAERAGAGFDYGALAVALASGDPDSKAEPVNWPLRGMWQRYQHHFASRKAMSLFFAAIDSAVIRFTHDITFEQAAASLAGRRPDAPALVWDETLLPRETVPHLFRQWLRDKSATRKFLTALFAQFQQFNTKGSTGRRAILVAQTARKIGWKPQKHTRNLVDTSDVRLSKSDYKADTEAAIARHAGYVGRFIRRQRKKQGRPQKSGKNQA